MLILTQWILYCGGRIIYNIYWHPLAKFPGPALRAAAFLPYYWAMWLGIEPLTTKTFHDEYGPVVRINPNTLSFITAQAWKDIYGLHPGKVQLPKNTVLAQNGFVQPLPSIKDDAEHARVRALISPAFSERAVREQESLVMNFVDLLIQRLKTQIEGPTGGEVDLVRWYNFATFDIIGDLSLGQSFDSLKAGKYHVWITNIFGGMKNLVWIQIVQAYPMLEAIMTFFVRLFPSALEGQRVHREYTQLAVQKRLATKTDRKDFISFFSLGLTDDELNINAALLLLAGSETSATALSAATYHLLTHKAVLDKVCKEVRNAFHSQDEITFTAVSQLSYLNAVIEESLRMYPTIPTTHPRFSLPVGTIIDGHFVPGNVSHIRSSKSSPKQKLTKVPPDRRRSQPISRESIPDQFPRPGQVHPRTLARRPALRRRPAIRRPIILHRSAQLHRTDVSLIVPLPPPTKPYRQTVLELS